MPSRDEASLKKTCNELARRLMVNPSQQLLEMSLRVGGHLRPAPRANASDAGAPRGAGGEAQASLEPAGALDAAVATAPSPPRGSAPPRPISLWRPTVEDGELAFVRPPPTVLGDGYCQRRRFFARKRGFRVALLGESVAQGFLYAPHLTPAQVLEAQLTALRGVPCEVVDLSRSSESMSTLLQTLDAATQLELDAAVVFAGNNWTFQEADASPHIPAPGFRARLAGALRQGGIAGARELAQRQLAHKTELVLSRIAEISAMSSTRRLPVVLVVPEVNLADWQSRQPVAWRAGDDTARWHELYRRAVRALGAGQPSAALALADELVAIDEGTCPSSHRVRAEAYRQLGQRELAAAAARAEVDSDLLPTMAHLHGPQTTTAVRQALVTGGGARGFAVVDLADVFAEHLAGELPGRRLFLDYCHLTAEGMAVAMAAVSSALGARAGVADPAPSWRAVLARAPGPTPAPEVEAVAQLGAAIHAAHRMLAVTGKAELLRDLCRRALDAAPELAEAMLALIELRASPCPPLLAAAVHRGPAAHHLSLLQHGLQWPALDLELARAMCEALEERGVGARARATAVWLRWAAVGEAPVELTRELWVWDPNESFYADALNLGDARHRCALRAAQPEQSFALVTDAAHELELEAVVRVPEVPGAAARAGTVALAVNGVPVVEAAVSERWTTLRARVPAARFEVGPNRVSLRWPPPPPVGEAALRAAVERLERDLPAELHPVFGEVFSLTVRRARAVPS